MSKHKEKNLGPVKKKSFKQLIVQRLQEDYGLLGDKVISLLAEDIIRWCNEYSISAGKIGIGQVLWLAVAKEEKHHPHKRIEDTLLKPVVLTLHCNEDVEMLLNGKTWYEVVRHRAARLFNEAYEQGSVLTQADVALLVSHTRATIRRYIGRYQKENNTNIPYRGKVHDMGLAVSHKREIVELMIKGHPTPDVAAKMKHSINACDNYYKDYKKVVMLKEKFPAKEIPYLAGLTESLVNEYLKMAEIYGNRL